MPRSLFRLPCLAVSIAALASAGCQDRGSSDASAGDTLVSAAGIVYSDTLAKGWRDRSTATSDLANASPVADGTRSISVDFVPWTALYFRSSQGVSTAAVTDLSFYVNGGADAGKALGVCITIRGTQQTKVGLAQYCEGGVIPANAWTRCKVPLSAIDGANRVIDGVVVQEIAGLTLSRTYVDAISFTSEVSPAPTPPPAPTGLAATASSTGVTLAWNAVAGATGYEVYRSASSGGTVTNLTSAPLTATTYTDSSVSAGSTYWYSVSAVNAAGEGSPSAAVSATVPASGGSTGGTITQKIYGDVLLTPWNDWSWATRNLANTSTVEAGADAISAQMGAWQGLYFERTAFTPDAGSSLMLWVNGGTAGGAALQVRAVVNGSWTAGTDLGQYCDGGTIPANRWAFCVVPMSAVAPAGVAITGISVQEWRGSSLPTMYFDEIALGTASSSSPAPVAITVSPTSSTLAAGTYQQFSATVSGTTNTGVAWSVQEGGAGGSITAAGLYNAPATAGIYHVVATSAADATKSATAVVTVTTAGPSPSVSIAISPTTAAIATNGTQQFSAAVSGSTDTGVAWSVQEGAAGGAVTASGLYSAPATAGTYHVVATSAADATKSAIAFVTVSDPAPPPTGGGTADTSILPADRRTVWNPGILSDGQLGLALGPDRLPVRTTVCATLPTGSSAATIQNALDACPQGQVVQLAAGSWSITANPIVIPSGVVLRGAGRGSGGTRLTVSSGAIVFQVKGGGYQAGVSVTASVANGATQVSVSNAASFNVGDMILIDQLDDMSYVVSPLPDYYNWNNPGRTTGQITEVVGKSGNNLIVYDPATGRGAPIHGALSVSQSPMVYRYSGPAQWSGVEDLYIAPSPGNGNPGISFENGVRNSWIKNVEFAGAGWKGSRVGLAQCFRCVFRDSYIHDASSYYHGGDGYGLRMFWHTSESLIENDVIKNFNKPLTMQGTGGGNVIGYNFVDDAWDAADPRMQETAIDVGHASFPHHELVEGNWAANVATENVWGNQGWTTVFRNYLSSQQSRSSQETYQIAAITFEAHSRYMSVVGNVLGASGVGLVDWNLAAPAQNAVWRIGQSPNGGNGYDYKDTFESSSDPASTYTQLFRDGNFDNVAGSLSWNASNSSHALPASLYLTSKPSFFGTMTWPWVDPTGATAADRVKSQPAYSRWRAGTP